MHVKLSVSFCETPYSMVCAPEWLRKALEKQRPGEWLRTRGQSSKGSAAWHPEWLPASEPRRPFHLPAATSGRSNDRVNMHTVLASCSISHYDPIFWINSLRMPTIFWNKTTHYFHIPYTYICFPNEDNLWISPDQRAIAKNKLAIKTFTVWLMPLISSRTSSKRSGFKIKNQNLANVFSPLLIAAYAWLCLLVFRKSDYRHSMRHNRCSPKLLLTGSQVSLW